MEEKVYRLTPYGCFTVALENFCFDITEKKEKAIWEKFLALMEKSGHIAKREVEDQEECLMCWTREIG